MSKNQKNINKSSNKSPVKVEKPKFVHNKKAYLIIFVLTFLLYGNTIRNNYALDDLIVITENKFTIQGFDGIKSILTEDMFMGYYGNMSLVQGSRYRPLSLVTFAIEYQFFKKNPHVGHFINILLFAFTGILIFMVLSKLLIKFKSKQWYFSVPFITAILFVAHPIHTEAVANIKGRDEILALLGSFAALWFVIKYLETKEFKNYLFAIITYFLALLSKENAITFLAVIPLSIYFFTNNKVKENLQASSSLIIPVIVYLFIRQTITGGTSNEITDIMNNSFFGVTFSQKYGTILYTLGLYIKLLIFPHPLTYDYYPYHIPLINLDDLRAMIPLLIYIGLLYYAYIGFKKKDIMSFSILYYLCTLSIVSNIFFSIGIFMNERFIFTSSIAFCLIIAYLLIYKLPEIIKTPKVYQTTLITFLLIILSLYSYKTISRNKDWKDDRTLNFADVKTSDNSAKGNATVGFLYMEEADTTKDTVQRKELFERAIVHYKKAIEIHPTYVNTMINLGATYYKYKLDSKKTIYWYAKALQLNSKYENVYKSLQTLLDMIQNTPENIDYKIGVLNNLYKIYPDRYEINYKLGAFYQMKNDQKMSQYFLERASKLNPDNMNQPIIK